VISHAACSTATVAVIACAGGHAWTGACCCNQCVAGEVQFLQAAATGWYGCCQQGEAACAEALTQPAAGQQHVQQMLEALLTNLADWPVFPEDVV
jgi:hypothetical protein